MQKMNSQCFSGPNGRNQIMFDNCPVANIRCLTCYTRCAFIVLLVFLFCHPLFCTVGNETCRSGMMTFFGTDTGAQSGPN